jgi:hypothetical protein
MDVDQLRRILDELEPGMSVTLPKDWITSAVTADNEAERDVKTIEFVLEYNCTWERQPDGKKLTFEKQAAPDG